MGLFDSWFSPGTQDMNLKFNGVDLSNMLPEQIKTFSATVPIGQQAAYQAALGKLNIDPSGNPIKSDAGGLGFNMGTMELGLKGLQSLGNAFMGWQAGKMADKQYKLAKQFGEANLTNQINSYNTALEDRIRSRYGVEGRSQADADTYINQHKLNR